MTPRKAFLITAAMLCHLLLATPLVTSQLHEAGKSPAEGTPNAGSQSESVCAQQADQEKDVPTMCAIQQEKDGAVYKLTGAVEIHYGSYVLRADQITYNSDTGDISAEGHFTLDGGPNDDHIRASHGTYNLNTETGRFFDVTGTTGLRFTGNRVILTSTAPFAFTGRRVERTSPDHYLVFDGTITTCELPHPKWQFNAHRVVVDVGGNASIYHSAFLLHGLPILYFPFATHPVQRETRSSGFLMPSIGRSSSNGTTLGEAAYWAINRSMDATVGAEYLSRRGWSQRGEFRARPTDDSYIDLNYFGVHDRGIGSPPVKQGGENARLNAQGNFDGFRGVANVDYLSSYLFRLAFNEVFSQAVYSEVKSQAFVSKSENGISFNGTVQHYQNFQSTTPGDVITINHAPGIDVSSVDQPIGGSSFYWSFDSSVGALSRSEPRLSNGALGPRTGYLGRFDLNPQISVPLLIRGWSLRPELTLHETYYTARLVANTPQDDPINRRALETAVELRPPALERIFQNEHFGSKWKHVIEPRMVYRYLTGVNNFANILRFDDRDILSDTHEVEYGVVNRFYAKRVRPQAENCDVGLPSLTVGAAAPEQSTPWQRTNNVQSECPPGPDTREVATWEIAQKYFIDPTFGGALIPGQRNVVTTTSDLTGIAFLTQPRHLSPLVSRLRVETSQHTDTEWDLDYDFQLSRVNASTLLANYHVGPFTIGGGDAFLQIPQQNAFSLTSAAAAANSVPLTQKFHQFRAALGYGGANKRGFSVANSFGIDANTRLLQFATVQTTYNWDCCGMTLEYRRYAIANVRNENLYRFTFNLANIGSFGNLRRPERLY
jgi:LPS-assembly protein